MPPHTARGAKPPGIGRNDRSSVGWTFSFSAFLSFSLIGSFSLRSVALVCVYFVALSQRRQSSASCLYIYGTYGKGMYEPSIIDSRGNGRGVSVVNIASFEGSGYFWAICYKSSPSMFQPFWVGLPYVWHTACWSDRSRRGTVLINCLEYLGTKGGPKILRRSEILSLHPRANP